MKSYADYTHFGAEDFLADASFRAWIRQPGPERHAYWRGLVRTHPHLKPEVDQARLLALGLESSWTEFSDAYVEEHFQRLYSEGLHVAERPEGRVLPLRPWKRVSAAACLVVLLAAGGWSYDWFFTEKLLQTTYGQLQTVTLYDGSVVTLNANSRLRLPSRWDWRRDRRVWLDGEAYFSVTKQAVPEGFRKFTVHTTRLDVEVPGTRFNVYARPARTQVLLDEGRVQLRDASTHRALTLRPGQLVEYGAEARQVVRQPAPAVARSLSAYRQDRLLFDDAPLPELARRFEEVYGLGLLFEGKSFENQRFTGELPASNLDKAVLILAESFDAPMIYDVLPEFETWILKQLNRKPGQFDNTQVLRDVLVGGQSVINDINFLRFAYRDKKLKWPFSNVLLDLHTLSYFVFEILKANGRTVPRSLSLKAISEFFGFAREDAHHNALEDAALTAACFREVMKLGRGLRVV